MNVLIGYASSEDEKPIAKKPKITDNSVTDNNASISTSLAPFVDVVDYSTVEFVPGETTKELAFNVAHSELSRPMNGPLNPFSRLSSSAKTVHTGKNNNQKPKIKLKILLMITLYYLISGAVEEYAMNEYTFNQLERTYQKFKYTLDPNDPSKTIGKNATPSTPAMLISELPKSAFKPPTQERSKGGDPSDIDFRGPWAGYKDEFVYDVQNAPTAQQIAASEQNRMTSFLTSEVIEELGEKTIFHGGRNLYDYQGRGFTAVPDDIDVSKDDQVCYLPKKCIHTWSGHTKGKKQKK